MKNDYNRPTPAKLALGFMIVTLAANIGGIQLAANVALAGLGTYHLSRYWIEKQ